MAAFWCPQHVGEFALPCPICDQLDRWKGEATFTENFARGFVKRSHPKPDMVNHPPHYQRGGLECIDAIEAMVDGWPAHTAVRLGHVLRYVWRHREKGGMLENLRKARWYLDREIAALEKDVAASDTYKEKG